MARASAELCCDACCCVDCVVAVFVVVVPCAIVNAVVVVAMPWLSRRWCLPCLLTLALPKLS
eukprot:14026686-Alexandrium_andersonii.AAC.1